MKIKYQFKNIHSNADTIKVTCGTEDIITLNKSDFNDNWETALNKDYYITEAQCNDLANLRTVGAEEHTAIYEEDVNTKWKEFTKNKIGTKHLDDTLALANVDSSLPIKIYNQEDYTSESDMWTGLHNIYSCLHSNYKIDFSNIKLPSFSKISYSSDFFPCRYNSGILDLSSNKVSSYITITDWFDIPEGVTDGSYGFYYCCLTKMPKLPNSLTKTQDMFAHSTITTIDNINLSNLIDATDMFYDCLGLRSVGDINLPNATSVTSIFSYCKNLVSIGNINLPNLSFFSLGSYLNSLTQIGNITYGSTFYFGKASVNVGIMNMLVQGSNRVPFYDYWPITAVAIPYYLPIVSGNSTTAATEPSSTGYNDWVDYYSDTGTDYIHNITNPVYNITENQKTLNNTETIYIKNFNILEKNASYNHTFEITSCSLGTRTSDNKTSGTNVDTTNMAFELNEDGTVNLTIPCTNIKDDSVSSGQFVRNITYVANIDGWEFHGGTKVTVNFSYTWTIDEDVSISAQIVEDDTETTEETASDSSESEKESSTDSDTTETA